MNVRAPTRPAEAGVPPRLDLRAAEVTNFAAQLTWLTCSSHTGRRRPCDDGCGSRPAPALVGHLAALAAREHACCSFFTFTLHPAGDSVTLDVQAPDDAAAVIADFFGAPQ